MNSNRQQIFNYKLLPDVYRRDKDFLKQRKSFITHNEVLVKTEKESVPRYYVKEDYYNIPCNCETSSTGRLVQNFFNGIKMGIEFFLFVSYVIVRRDELLECNYPFVQRTTHNNEMKNLNTIRYQLNQKPSPIKHTITDTYYDIH